MVLQCRDTMAHKKCEHGKFKQQFRVCNKKAFCTHDRREQTCKECGGRGLCKAPKCKTTASRRYKGHCLQCFVHLFPHERNERNYKTKESAVAVHL